MASRWLNSIRLSIRLWHALPGPWHWSGWSLLVNMAMVDWPTASSPRPCGSHCRSYRIVCTSGIRSYSTYMVAISGAAPTLVTTKWWVLCEVYKGTVLSFSLSLPSLYRCSASGLILALLCCAPTLCTFSSRLPVVVCSCCGYRPRGNPVLRFNHLLHWRRNLIKAMKLDHNCQQKQLKLEFSSITRVTRCVISSFPTQDQ